jgi:hypothetical protein
MKIVTTTADGTIVSEVTVEDPPFAGLDQFAAGWALLACTGVVSVEDAANVAGCNTNDLVNEVLSWEAAGG